MVSKIRDALNRLGGRVEVVWRRDGDADLVTAKGQRFILSIYVDVSRGLSSELTVLDRDGRITPLEFKIDTDLYDIRQAKYHPFVREIARQMVDLVASLASGAVRTGTFKGKPALLVPVAGGAALVYKGRFATTTRHLSRRDDDRLSDLRPVHVADLGPDVAG